MGVAFDRGAASELVSSLGSAAGVLRGQSQFRRLLVEGAAADFQGVYARLFTEACFVESEDRPRLAGVLEELWRDVDRAKEEADREDQRERELCEWQARERERQEELATGDVVAMVRRSRVSYIDPKPSEVPIRPTPISASFAPRSRERNGSGDSSGTSSADPVTLWVFASAWRNGNAELRGEFERVRNAWAAFTSRSSWVPVESASVIMGFERYLTQNTADADWVDRIAQAFEDAGSGSISNTTLALAVGKTLPPGIARLLEPGLSSVDAARAWAALGLGTQDLLVLPLSVQFRLANLDGIPATSRDVLSRQILSFALQDPQAAYVLMNLSTNGPDLDTFTTHINDLNTALQKADDSAKYALGPAGNRVAQLIGLGVHEGVLISAISLGNLDTADNVSVNVPGMNSSLSDMPSLVNTAQGLFKTVNNVRSGSYAVVSWVGYRAAGTGNVGTAERSKPGGENLARFMNGVYDSRGVTPPGSFTVLGHSYGSTTAFEGVQRSEHKVTNFISYGSVGFENKVGSEENQKDLSRQDINAQNVYATEADQDRTADMGRFLTLGNRIDPREIPEITVFSSESEPGSQGVTGHDMNPTQEGQVGYLSEGSTSMKNIADIIARSRL